MSDKEEIRKALEASRKSGPMDESMVRGTAELSTKKDDGNYATLYEVQNMFNSLRMKRIVRIRNKYNQAIQYEHKKRSTYYAQNQRKQEPRQI